MCPGNEIHLKEAGSSSFFQRIRNGALEYLDYDQENEEGEGEDGGDGWR